MDFAAWISWNWCELQELDKHAGTDWLPLLRPDNAARARAYQRWFSDRDLPRGVANTNRPVGLATKSVDGKAVLVYGGDAALVTIARWYSKAAGHLFAGPIHSPDPKIAECAAIVVVGLANSLSPRLVQARLGPLRKSWSVLTADDLAGLSFLMAKQMLRWPSPCSVVGAIDVINNILHKPDGSSTTIQAKSGKIFRVPSLDALVIHAHGNEAHLKLDNAVICGALHTSERMRDGTLVPGGCVGGPTRSPDACKRTRRDRVKRIRAADLPTSGLVLLSCNTFVVPGGQFPSDCSLLLSALEGNASWVIGVDRLVSCSREDVAWFCSMLRSGASPSVVCMLANDRWEERTGERPWILAGDDLRPTQPSSQIRSQDASVATAALRADLQTLWSMTTLITTYVRSATKSSRINKKLVRQGTDLLLVIEKVSLGALANIRSTDEIAGLIKVYETLAKYWGSCVSQWIHSQVLKEPNGFFIYTRDLSSLSQRKRIGSCDKCGDDVSTSLWRYYLPLPHRVAVTECFTCGVLAASLSKNRRLTIKAPAKIGAGQDLEVVARLSESPDSIRGTLIVWLSELGNQKPRPVRVEVDNSTALRSGISVRLESSRSLRSDLHAIHAALISGPQVLFARRRISGIALE